MAPAQTVTEAAHFDAAARAFQGAVYDRSFRDFTTFIRNYPESVRWPEAVLLQARSALQLKQASIAVDILTTNYVRAGAWADQYHYWLAETYLSTSNYQAAAESFADLIQNYPRSLRLLDASYKAAWARFRMGQMEQVVTLLRNPDGTFQKAAVTRTNDTLVVDGHLLLAEALLGLKEYQAAEKTLEAVSGRDLLPQANWQWHYLRCRILAEDGRLNDALVNTSNLVALAVATGERALEAESVTLQARILEQGNDPAGAARAYERNLAEGIPEDRRRQALLKIVELMLGQGKVEEAMSRLEKFHRDRPQDAAADVALLTLGELHLKEHLRGAPRRGPDRPAEASANTNHLQQALGYFNLFLTNFPSSALAGKAFLNKGWCLWTDNRFVESQAAFKRASELLPFSFDQAVARFKWADAQFRAGDHTNALQNFRAVVTDYAGLLAVEELLFAHAHYQMLRASLAMGDLESATAAMRVLLDKYPNSAFRAPGMLLVGQALSAAGEEARARADYEKFIAQFPDSPLVPEVSLALARDYVADENWEKALGEYEQWLTRYPSNELRPLAEYNRAWISYKARAETNALTYFTNFVAAYPTNELTAHARYWIGDFYFRQRNFYHAQINYQKLAESFPGTPLAYQARMMAGRSASELGFWLDARGHFNALLNDRGCPPEIVAQAFFALGDTMLRGGVEGGQTRQKFDDALVAFTKIPELPDLAQTNRLIALAWGRIGDCHLQLAEQDPRHYALATNAYLKVIQSPYADVAARSQAAFGIALVLEKQARGFQGVERQTWLTAARDQYLDVVDGRLNTNGHADPFWFKEAGLAAANLAEEQQQWEIAVNLYQRLLTRVPPLQAVLEKKLLRAQEQLRLQEN